LFVSLFFPCYPNPLFVFRLPRILRSFLFFFYPSSLLLYLHSFPTRRSSDLFAIIPQAAARPRRGPPASFFLASSSSAAGRSRCRDRKSTRLNSSHGSISYAVFCLKKKNDI